MKAKPPRTQLHVIELASHDRNTAHIEVAQLTLQLGLVGLWMLHQMHDDGCRAMDSEDDTDCRPPCVPNFVLMSFEAHTSLMAFDQAQKARRN